MAASRKRGIIMKWTFLRERIQKMCDDNDISVKEMCMHADIKYTTLSSFLTGDSKTTSLDNIQAIADFFNVPLDYLMRPALANYLLSQDVITLEPKTPEYELVSNYRVATPPDQSVLLRFASFAAQVANKTPDLMISEPRTFFFINNHVREQERSQTNDLVTEKKQ